MTRFGVLAGSLFVVLWLAGSIVQGTSGAGFPRPDDDMAKVGEIMRAGAAQMEASAGLQLLGALALLGFAAAVAARLRGAGSAGAELALTGGIMAACTLLFSVSALIALGSTDLATDDASAQMLYQLSFWLGGPIHVGGLGLLILAAAHGLGLPKWLGIAGLVIGTAGVLSTLAPIVSPLVAFTPIGRFLGFIWIVVATVLLVVRTTAATAKSAEPVNA